VRILSGSRSPTGSAQNATLPHQLKSDRRNPIKYTTSSDSNNTQDLLAALPKNLHADSSGGNSNCVRPAARWFQSSRHTHASRS
jgi:hypothetical protein